VTPGASALARVRIVLIGPREPGNVGAAARAMKNMGLADLVLVAPVPLDVDAAATMAVHARDVLARHRRVATLAEAIGDCGLVVATSGRVAGDTGGVSPRTLAPTILDASDANAVALVFGPEDHGLSNDELMRCQRVITIPTAADYASLNLAQAVLICGYELALAAATRRDAAVSSSALDATAAPPSAERAALAPTALAEQMYAALERALHAIGFLHRDNGVHMMRAFRRMLGRAALDVHDAHILLGLARQISWIAGRAGKRPPDDDAPLTTDTHPGS
jgi:tRNA/rRNA methyltransferase